ncbi:MAG: phospho-N-acetylmuramoyl-pentapeptide-transferase [Candidatus Wildermuthbacteria bacterium]|nr:phospho-N-acetylmuramoyl-pentapeptide-transferase [Candidatus Wildermuthbacteria bacterium]
MFSDVSLNVIKLGMMGAAAFLFGFLLAPPFANFLYTHKLWRKKVRTQALGGGEVPFFQKFHAEGETGTPRFGGVLVWLIPPLLALFFWLLSFTETELFEKLNFLSRSQTWLPLATLLAASAVGFLDDLAQVVNVRGLNKYIGGGLELKYRFGAVFLIALVGAWWFYYKLGWTTFHVPGVGDFDIGLWYIPLFILVMLATYSGGVIDGLDGLAGGVFASIFTGYGIIAFARDQFDLATFSFAIVGALLAFLWFNIPPARFYMGETGIIGLTATLTVVAFLTDSVAVLPIIGFLLVLESGSVIIQLLSKKFRKKKILLAAPIHHHFEAKGWPHYKVTMRFWVIGVVMAIAGVAIRLFG